MILFADHGFVFLQICSRELLSFSSQQMSLMSLFSRADPVLVMSTQLKLELLFPKFSSWVNCILNFNVLATSLLVMPIFLHKKIYVASARLIPSEII